MGQIENIASRILVLGIRGMAGHVIFSTLSELGNYDVFGLARNIQTTKKIFSLDVTNTTGLKEILNLEFDIVINCIGVLNEKAEDNPDKAIWLNSYFPHLLESLTKNTKTKIITVSTDCVFSGTRGNYTETDVMDGEGFYSKSKSLGEIKNNKDLTIRTSIIGPDLNENGIGLFNWFMLEKKAISGYTKAFWSGLTTTELARVIHQAIQQNIHGLLIVGGSSKISKFQLLELFNKIFKGNTLTIEKNAQYKTDKSMFSSRVDFNYTVQSYEDMLLDMKSWMLSNDSLYNHYTVIEKIYDS